MMPVPSRRPSAAVLAWLLVAAPAALATPQPDARLLAAVGSPGRTPKFVGRDANRHPADELAFFGIRPDASVVEIWPGGGYWTEILGPYLAESGTYTVALPMEEPSEHSVSAFHAKFDAKPWFAHVHLTTLDVGKTDIAPPGSADFVLTFRNVHNWMKAGDADAVFAAFFKALKPGGILGVEEHRGLATMPQDPKAISGYVRQDYTIALAEKAGFHLVGTSELNANPKDTKIWPQGVWTLPPSFALGAVDHAKYAAIGEADNFILKFQKPAP